MFRSAPVPPPAASHGRVLAVAALLAWLVVALWADATPAADPPDDQAYRRPWKRKPVAAGSAAAGAPQRRRDLGAPLEAQEPRRWRETRGGEPVDAVLVAIDAASVTLRLSDGTERTIPVAALEPLDRLVALRELRRSERGRPEDHVNAIHDADSAPRPAQPLVPEPFVPVVVDPDAPGARRPPNASWTLRRDEATTTVTGLFPAGDEEDDWVLAETTSFDPRARVPTVLRWLRPDTEEPFEDAAVISHELPDGEVVLDHHPVLELLLSMARRPIGGGAERTPDILTLWDVSPRLDRPAPVARWTATTRTGWRRPWGRIVDDGLVLFLDRDRKLLCWDAWSGKVRWHTPQDSSTDARPALDASRTKLLLPEDAGIRVIDAVGGAELATVSCPERCAAAALGPDGRRLAIVAGGRIRIHDLASPATPPILVEAPASDAVAGEIAWMDDGIVAATNQVGRDALVLYSTETGLPLRRYVAAAPLEVADATTTVVPGGVLSLVAPPFAESRTTLGTVVATRLPEPEDGQTSRRSAPGLPPVVAPGSAVNVYTLCGRHDAEVRGLLMDIVRRHGWVYDRESPVTLAGYLFEQKPEEIAYRTPRSAIRRTTVCPTIASIRIVTPDAVLYEKSSGAFTFDPFTADDGQSPQDWVDRVLPPGPAFFRSVSIPDTIPDPRERFGAGTSVLEKRGPEPLDEP